MGKTGVRFQEAVADKTHTTGSETKFAKASRERQKLLLPGAHSAEGGEAGEELPPDVIFIQEFLEHQEVAQPSAQAKQGCQDRRTIERSFIGQQPPLGEPSTELRTQSTRDSSSSSSPLITSLPPETHSMLECYPS